MTQSHDPRVMEEAERWFTRLEWGDSTVTDRHQFEQWRASPKNAAAYEGAQRLWEDCGRLEGMLELERLSAQVWARTAPGARRFPGGRWTFALAASVAVGVFTAVGFWMGRYEFPASYTTQEGERSAFRLSDGSQVILNSATRLDVKFGVDRREFILRRGEAMFTVAQDHTRPFVVSAGDGEVTALGTRFQVRNERDSVVVTLLEGRVAVERAGHGVAMQLQPSEQVKFAAENPEVTRRVVDADVVSSWTVGRLRFKHTPVVEVLAEVNRYSTVKIRLVDAALEDLPVNGTFDTGDSVSVVSALQRLLAVEVVRQTSSEIVLARRSE